MKKRLVLILVLMSTCVVGIVGLQLFWNYQNYTSTVKNFTHNSNEALALAVNREITVRHLAIVEKFKHWLADTSFITITCDNKNRTKETVFHMRDTHPIDEDRRPVSIGLNNFKESLAVITPEAKAFFIEHFGNTILMGDLKKGIVYFYTQRIGDSLSVAYDKSKLNLDTLRTFYKEELALKGVHAAFEFNPRENNTHAFITQKINTALRDPYQKEPVYAGFASPFTYFLKEMKWVITSTLLLIGITLFCFGYTVKTLLSQQKLAELKDNFINNMTHELNTPITSIRITSEALRTFKHSPETEREYLAIIGQQTEKLTDLTTQILNTNSLVVKRKSWKILDVRNTIQFAIDNLSLQAEKQHAIIEYQISGEEINVKGDAESLLNAFTNVIDNALKYTPQGLELTIASIVQKGYVEISFADNGPGIPEEYRKQIFENFFRVPQGNTHNVKGYGLGLSYVQQVVSQHRGSVTVSGNQPHGSIFKLTFPLAHG
jgi:two-component system, OmpR family, phosphate regulon sensor histidine kinase PhoR